MYCTGCSRFNDNDEWLIKWRNTAVGPDRDKFAPLRCGWCYAEGPAKSGGKSRFQALEQVHFVMTSLGGHLADVPWPQWALRNLHPVDASAPCDEDDAAQSPGTAFDMDAQLPEGGSLPESAMGIPYGKGNDLMKPVLRSSTSVYYPNIVHSLYLPVSETGSKALTQEMLNDLKSLHAIGVPPEILQQRLSHSHGQDKSLEEVNALIASNFHLPPPETGSPDGEDYWQAEYNYITGSAAVQTPERMIEPVPIDAPIPGVAAFYRLDKLKLTSVQTSFTWQQPLERDAFLTEPEPGAQQPARRYTTKYNRTTHTLQAVECYGLVSLARRGQLPAQLASAIARAKHDCAADPICWHTDSQGQGAGGLNMAACQSCTLLPETSCEEFNSYLDRRLAVDP